MKPSPAALWFQAQREHPTDDELRRSRFQSLMRLHGHIVPKTPENEPKHNHVTRDIKDCGAGCPACDDYHWQRRARAAAVLPEPTSIWLSWGFPVSDTFTVELRDVPTDAATEVLLAIESWAERIYGSYPATRTPENQRRYNDLAAIVLPLRAALDEAVASGE